MNTNHSHMARKSGTYEKIGEREVYELYRNEPRTWAGTAKDDLGEGFAERFRGMGAAYAMRWAVREHLNAILVHAKGPDRSGLPARDGSHDDAPVRSGLSLRILPPEADAHPARGVLTSRYDGEVKDNPLGYLLHFQDAVSALAKFGLLPREESGRWGYEIYELKLSRPLEQVPALVRAYLDLPSRGLEKAVRFKSVPHAKTLEEMQEPRTPRR
jgi:hypothetical protein